MQIIVRIESLLIICFDTNLGQNAKKEFDSSISKHYAHLTSEKVALEEKVFILKFTVKYRILFP